MTAAELLLDQYLGLYYQAAILGRGTKDFAVSGLRTLIERLGGMRELAQTRLNELERFSTSVGGELEKRCAISAQQLACLRLALNP